MMRTLQDSELYNLKNRGHVLLDEYICLCLQLSKKNEKNLRNEAYVKLERQLKSVSHFGMMRTRGEVMQAITRLERMIQKKMTSVDKYAFHKNVIAPNVAELQKQANSLNPQYG